MAQLSFPSYVWWGGRSLLDTPILPLLLLLLLLGGALPAVVATTLEKTAPWGIELLITSNVNGAMYPTAQPSGEECSAARYNASPCECYGGAARLAGVLEMARANSARDVVPVDVGGFFYGSGSFFPEFGVSVPARLFSEMGYVARSLSLPDMMAGWKTRHIEPSGGEIVASYLEQSQPNLTVVTNLNVTADPHLGLLVTNYAVYSLEHGRTMAFLSLIDASPISRYYVPRVLSLRRSLEVALHDLVNLPTGRPNFIMLALHMISSDDINELLTQQQQELWPDTPENVVVRSYEALAAIVSNFLDIDLIVVDSGYELGAYLDSVVISESQRYSKLRNWAGGTTYVTTFGRKRRGAGMTNVSLDFSDHLRGTDGRSRSIVTQVMIEDVIMDCGTAENEEIRDDIDALKEQVDASLRDDVFGWLAAELNGAPIQPGSCVVTTTVHETKPTCGCALAECTAGDFVADALRWYGEVDVAFVDAESLRSSIPPGPVTRADLLNLVPGIGFADDVLLFFSTGASLRAMIQECFFSTLKVADNATIPWCFLQFSSSVQFQWYYRSQSVLLADGTLRVNGELVRDDASYTFASQKSTVNAFYDTLDLDGSQLPIAEIGASLNDVTAAYLSALHADADTALDPRLAYNIGNGTMSRINTSVQQRIEQLPDVLEIHVAILCRILNTEECDHLSHTIDLVNAHGTDLFGDVLPHGFLRPQYAEVGCSEGRAYGALLEMLRTNPKIHGVFAFCSDDVADVSSVDARANLTNDLRSYGVAFDATNFVVLSASSTATEISSESYYPHVARLSSPESEVGKAVSSLVDHYGWRRVAVVHDDSLWARSSAQSFIDAISSRVDFVTFLGSGICLGGNCNGAGETLGITVSRSGFNVTEILDVLEALDARIIYLATYVQQEIFAEMYRQRRIWGSDYALITNLPQTASLVDDYHNVDIDAVKGQEGSLGFIQYAPSYGEETVVSDYLDSWRQVMSVDACNSRVESTNATILDGDDASSAPYCDVDGDFTTSHDYSMFCVDAIVIFAKAIAAQELNTNSRLLASETYAMILNQTFEGSSGTVQLHPDSGDRLGKFSLLNLQINEAMESSSAARRALWNSYEPQRQLVVILESLQAEYVIVGSSVSASYTLEFNDVSIYFPGGSTRYPADGPTGQTNDDKRTYTYSYVVVMLCAAILGMFLIVFVVSRHRMKANFRRTLRMIQSTNVDIFEAIQPFEPGDLGRHFSFDDKMMSDEGEERKEPDCPELGELPPRDKPECGATLRLLNFPSALPCELQGQGALPVRVGMFIRVVRTYSDPHGDWCYGIKILDSPLSSGDENHAFHTNSAGWFPTRCVKKAGHNLLRKSRSGTNEVMQLLRPPNSWSDVTDRRKAELMLLEDADLERIEVVSHFNIRTIEVLSVERVQNLSMWQCFMMKQAVVLTRENVSQDVNNNVADGKFVVYPVFHGTTGSVARKIVQQGFNRSFCGKHAVRLGKGVYFARDSGYSCMPKYSTPDEEGTQHVFVCRIVVGHACVGRNGALAPDIRNPDTLELYDTTVDSTSNPRIFVTYNDHQCYPCYLVKFRQRAALAMQVEPEQASHT